MPDGLVIDTSVLIDYRRNNPDAAAFLLGLLSSNRALVHPVCASELLQGALDRADLRRSIEFLAAFKRPAVKPADFEQCLALLVQLRLAHGIGWPDCLIAATCMRLRLPLVTLNDKHFRSIRGLKLVRPY
jgi:predicted nucleic acid-binding protein